MAHLYKKTFTTTDPRTGERVSRKRKNWRVRYRHADGQMRDVPAFKDKLASEQLAQDIERRVAREKMGIVDKFDVHRGRPLVEHLDEYEEHLCAKGNTEKHVKLKVGRIRKAIKGCGFSTLRDIVPSRVEGWLAGERDAKRFSAQTSNHYLVVLKGFCTWLVRERRAPDNALVGLSGVNVALDPKHQRRVLSEKDLAAFLKAAKKGAPFRGLSGRDRVMLYRVVLYTGLRLNEVATLTKDSFDLEADPPAVAVEAGYSKRRKRDVLVLRKDLAADLKRWLRWKRKGEPVFQGTWAARAGKMVQIDVEAAGLAYQEDNGRFFDFHALRHQFISSLAASGVHPATAQKMARHSDINLTLSRYTHVGRGDEAAAVEGLPGIGDGKRTRERA
jgi:integrase